MKLVQFLVILVIIASCKKDLSPSEKNNVTCLDELIIDYQKEPVTNPPTKIFKSEYDGKTFYYVPPVCCDIFSVLFDENCERICAPDGGITGDGDGQCPDFYKEITNWELIWEDTRE